VLIDLGVTERDGVRGIVMGANIRSFLAGIPKLQLIEKVKSNPIRHDCSTLVGVRAEKDGGPEDSLECLDNAMVVVAIFWQVEIVKKLRRAFKLHCSISLADRQRRNPNQNQTVLTEWHAESWVSRDIEAEFPISPAVGGLVLGRAPERNSTKDKWASVKSQVLLTLFSLLAHQVNSFELLETSLGDPDGRQDGCDWGKGRALCWRQGGVRPDGAPLGTGRKLCQSCM
jgi:hypothetical protein